MYGDVLIAAANKRTLQHVKILLRAGAGAKIRARNGKLGSALIAAAASPSCGDMDNYETRIVCNTLLIMVQISTKSQMSGIAAALWKHR